MCPPTKKLVGLLTLHSIIGEETQNSFEKLLKNPFPLSLPLNTKNHLTNKILKIKRYNGNDHYSPYLFYKKNPYSYHIRNQLH